jgi:hypothetical protein
MLGQCRAALLIKSSAYDNIIDGNNTFGKRIKRPRPRKPEESMKVITNVRSNISGSFVLNSSRSGYNKAMIAHVTSIMTKLINGNNKILQKDTPKKY